MGHSFKDARNKNLRSNTDPMEDIRAFVYRSWIQSRKRHNDYIRCIKEYRTRTGADLRSSKEFVDQLIGDPPWRDETLERKECPHGVKIRDHEDHTQIYCHFEMHQHVGAGAPRCYEFPGCNGKFKYKE